MMIKEDAPAGASSFVYRKFPPHFMPSIQIFQAPEATTAHGIRIEYARIPVMCAR